MTGSTTKPETKLKPKPKVNPQKANLDLNLKSTPIDLSGTKIPVPVRHACETLRDKGFEALLAGGCVRDLIMNRKPRDWDIVTNAPAEKIRELFTDHLEVGVAFGIFKLPPRDGVHMDIAIFRHEEGYSDQRHPDKVEPGDFSTDCARRDFTCNALYLDVEKQHVLDAVGGMKDIASKLLRTVGDPIQRFTEDALRMLRAARFSAQLGFKIERETSAAVKKCSVYLKAISRERVKDELWKLLTTSKPIIGLEVLALYGLWDPVFGVKRVSLPADLRHMKLHYAPPAIHWIAGMGITGLLGNVPDQIEEIQTRIADSLRLSNAEKKVLHLSLQLFIDSSPEPIHSPTDWLELSRQEKCLIDFLKAFVRRARGPTQAQKDRALAFGDQIQRWAMKPGSEKTWPSSQDLMKKGIKPGPKLGVELKRAQWETFWKTRPV